MAIPKLILFALSLIYGSIVRLAIFFYRIKPCRLKCKVISIGNITLGGTGKTPLVELVAGYLRKNGRTPAILTRGYKRRSRLQMGDEPAMLQRKLVNIPVIVGADRISGAKQAMQNYAADTVILDDGFQQWRIKKDLEIVAIDARNPFGNLHMLPRGILREPLSSLKRADIFVLTKADSAGAAVNSILHRLNPDALIVQVVYSPVSFYELGKDDVAIGPGVLKGKTVSLFCGIADPESFKNTVAGLGINIGLFFGFPDHYYYTKGDLESIIARSKEKGIDTIVTTEKDAARLCELGQNIRVLRMLALRVELKIAENEEKFYGRLLSLYSL